MKSLSIFSQQLMATLCFLFMTHLVCLAGEAKETTQAKEDKVGVCVVSGERLGEMGPPVIVQHNGREVHFCCKECVKDFNKNPDKYLQSSNPAKQ
jgi:YHS domain-containing protein